MPGVWLATQGRLNRSEIIESVLEVFCGTYVKCVTTECAMTPGVHWQSRGMIAVMWAGGTIRRENYFSIPESVQLIATVGGGVLYSSAIVTPKTLRTASVHSLQCKLTGSPPSEPGLGLSLRSHFKLKRLTVATRLMFKFRPPPQAHAYYEPKEHWRLLLALPTGTPTSPTTGIPPHPPPQVNLNLKVPSPIEAAQRQSLPAYSLHNGRGRNGHVYSSSDGIDNSTVLSTVLLYQVARQSWEQDKTNVGKWEAMRAAAQCFRGLVKSYDSLDSRGRALVSDCIAQYYVE
ncbi:hypothetical protein FA13DRAFT_1717048 [Coprinellus micaceus]|uniref:Uncharacterized protein n=1 Tax=Coprinellus micaceus TaxID=71717 RepID=A0A4Y7SHD2_COPMI|nr:hypothetical protein FA13DRAFT_1717048 [Coprinellus micaceus]